MFFYSVARVVATRHHVCRHDCWSPSTCNTNDTTCWQALDSCISTSLENKHNLLPCTMSSWWFFSTLYSSSCLSRDCCWIWSSKLMNHQHMLTINTIVVVNIRIICWSCPWWTCRWSTISRLWTKTQSCVAQVAYVAETLVVSGALKHSTRVSEPGFLL